MKDSLWLSTASAALLLTACGGARPEVKSAPPAAHPVTEYQPGPAPEVFISTSPLAGSIAVSTWTAPVPNVVPHEVAKPVAADANVLLLVAEAVGGPEEDLGSYTKVFVDNQPVGQTQMAPRSAQKRWGARLAPGNHLFRFEKWNLPMVGDWAALDAQWQPPERFIRMDEGTRAVVRLKFFDSGRGHNLQIAREPSSTPLP
ncbi:MAG: hypothetical protein HY077_13230 [Elusimicrobia bacterium]|nr:hypothetical protein [Elusimicrobiota bacterium]